MRPYLRSAASLAALAAGAIMLSGAAPPAPTVTAAGVVPYRSGGDDAANIQAAADLAIADNLPLLINQQYFTTKTVDASAQTSGAFIMTSNGVGVLLLASGQDVVKYAPTKVGAYAKVEISHFKIWNLGAEASGVVAHIDCTATKIFCTQGTSKIADMQLEDMAGAAWLRGVTSFQVLGNYTYLRSNTGGLKNEFLHLDGGISDADASCNSGIVVKDNQNSSGIFVNIVGCAQGVEVQDNVSNYGTYDGVIQTSPHHNEQIAVIHNIFEASDKGVYLPASGFDKVLDNEFDQGALGDYTHFQAVVVGQAHRASPNETISRNNVFGFMGHQTDTLFFANIGNGSSFDGNTVGGVVNTTSHVCMAVGTDDSDNANGITGVLSVVGNSGFVCGSMHSLGGTMSASANQFNAANGSVVNAIQ